MVFRNNCFNWFYPLYFIKMKCEKCSNEIKWNFFEKRYDCIKCGKTVYPHEIRRNEQKTLN